MTFWSSGKTEPVRKYRFGFALDTSKKTDIWWWAKTVTKPSYEVNSSEYQLINHKFKYPGILAWQDITISVVEVGSIAHNLLSKLGEFGHKRPTEKSEGLKKGKMQCNIFQYGASGAMVEKWTLHNVFIKAINFGELDYSSDDFVEIQITLMYDWAEFEKGRDTDKVSSNEDKTEEPPAKP